MKKQRTTTHMAEFLNLVKTIFPIRTLRLPNVCSLQSHKTRSITLINFYNEPKRALFKKIIYINYEHHRGATGLITYCYCNSNVK